MTNIRNITDTTAPAPMEERYLGVRTFHALRWAAPMGSVLVGAGIVALFYTVPPFQGATLALLALRIGLFIVLIPAIIAVLTNWAIGRGEALLAVERQGRQDAEERLRQEERFRYLLESMNDGYVIVLDEKVAFVNTKAAELANYELGQLLGRHYLNFIPQTSTDRARQCYEAVMSGNVVSGVDTMQIFTRDGRERTVRFNISRGEYSGKPTFVALVTDITEEIAAQRDLERRLRELEAVNQLNAQVLNERAAAIEALKDSQRFVDGIINLLHSTVAWEFEGPATFGAALGKGIEAMGGDAGELWMWEDEDQGLHLYAVRGVFAEAFRERTRFAPGEGLPGLVYLTKDLVVSTDLPHDPRFPRQAVKAAGYTSYIGIPIKRGKGVVGTIGVAYLKRREFSPDELQQLTAVSAALGLMVPTPPHPLGEKVPPPTGALSRVG